MKSNNKVTDDVEKQKHVYNYTDDLFSLKRITKEINKQIDRPVMNARMLRRTNFLLPVVAFIEY